MNSASKDLAKTVLKSFIYTLSVVIVTCLLISVSDTDNEVFITLFYFSIALIFSIFLSTFLIIKEIRNK